MIRLLPAPSVIPVDGSSWDQKARSRIVERLHRLLNRLGIPGIVQPMAFDDEVSGQHISIRTGVFFTVISIDGRDYYFRRLTGRLDGTGMGSCCPRS